MAEELAEVNEQWPALTALAGMDISRQRIYLRLHDETGFAAPPEDPAAKLRASLDRELCRIMVMEFRAQTETGDAAAIPGIPALAGLLQTSPPLIQYLNFYLYFGVRFAASRIPQLWANVSASRGDCNEPIPALPSPPICQRKWDNTGAADAFLEEIDKDQADEKAIALRFLDGFESGIKPETSADLVSQDRIFELWLNYLYSDGERESYFESLEQSLLAWAQSRYEFYTGLEARNPDKSRWVGEWKQQPWKEGRWTTNNPLAARCALLDFYWLAKILRAEVSAQGEVRYASHSWLYLLAMRVAVSPRRLPEQRYQDKELILRYEEVLRSVFGYACDLIQNAVDIAADLEDRQVNPQDYGFSSKETKKWRAVQDAEHDEIRLQREARQHHSVPGGAGSKEFPCKEAFESAGWSQRIWSGDQVDNLFGLALSGGGIRSATFSLGVLQKLQELDLLRHVDYLSSVSGGGYAAAWLVGNVRRTRYWLSRMTGWDASIDHLRRFSNYLAPHNGVLNPDTWSMWLTWIRNAFLVQLTGCLWLAVILMLALDIEPFFNLIGTAGQTRAAPHYLLAGTIVLSAAIIVVFLSTQAPLKSGTGGAIYRRGNAFAIGAAALVWFSSFLTAALLWGQAVRCPDMVSSYSSILQKAWTQWPLVSLVIFPVALIAMALATLRREVNGRSVAAFTSALLVPIATYAMLAGQLRFYGLLLASSPVLLDGKIHEADRAEWLAFAFGPAVTMLAGSVAIVLFIGLLGRGAPDWTREWWTRYGAWVGLLGLGGLIVTTAAVFAPIALISLSHIPWTTLKISGVAAWLGSTVSGLLAGKSSKTGEGGQKSQVLEVVARLGGLIFIVGAVALVSTVLYSVLWQALVQGTTANTYWQNLQSIVSVSWPANGVLQWLSPVRLLWLIPAALALLGLLFSNRFDLNTFGLNQFYRNRLVRCYLGATRWQPGKRHPHPFTAFDGDDDLKLSDLQTANKDHCNEPFRGPFPIINCTLNLGGSSDLAVHTRHGAAFVATPLYCGSSRPKVGYSPTLSDTRPGFAGGLTLGQAISVSGAAASPNMGYNTSPLVSFMMTMFNVRLGWWFPNPSKRRWFKSSPPSGLYLVSELFGAANETNSFVNISDGGHFENLGVYELIRRKARVIIAADAECDADLAFNSLGNLIRICQTDFGAEIDLDVSSIRKEGDDDWSRAHCAVGKITYSNGTKGYLIYIKSSLTGDEDVGVAQYRSGHPTFPHETTANQFYTEDQFEAYRRLGHHVTERTFRDAEDEYGDPFSIASKLFDIWVPAGFTSDAFLRNSRTFDIIWDRFRTDPNLKGLLSELTGLGPQAAGLTNEELCACIELLQLLENVFLDIRLDDFWDHPDNRGWVMFFTACARSPKFKESWNRTRSIYGIRFEYFCNQRLGMDRDRPVMRV